MRKYEGLHLAQVNIACMLTSLEDPSMHGFVSKLEAINALADSAPGFVWRLQTEEGNATYLRPYEDPKILFNLSVWESVAELKHYVYETEHVEIMRDRRLWFQKMPQASLALWWIKAGHIPSIQEAKDKLEEIRQNGPGPSVFNLVQLFEPAAQ